jgi:acetyltransferase
MDKIFNPQTVAVIGATNKVGSVGYALIKNLVGSGFPGTIYPVNFKAKSVYGVRSYSSVSAIRDEIDLAVIATPAPTVPDIIRECAEYGVGGVVIISAGFSEAGEKGKQMSAEILKIAKESKMRIIGPNCLGFIKPSLNLNVSFASKMAKPGKIAFISQSGALCTAILDWSVEQNVGFSHFVSIGSMIDVGFDDLIDYFGHDPNTNSIVIYMESLSNAKKFMSAARAFARNKPIIVLKAGKSAAGAKVALSHTGTLAGNDMAFDAAFNRAGVIRVNTIDQLFNAAQALSKQKRPTGNRLAIVTNAGGPGVLATDHLISHGGKLAELSEDSMKTLNSNLPAMWSHGNPIDVLGDADAERYGAAISTCLNDDNVDALLTIVTPQSMTDPKSIAEKLVELAAKTKKTMLASWMGAADVQTGMEVLEASNIPVFSIPEQAVNTFMNMHKYSENIKSLYETPSSVPHQFQPDYKKNKALVNRVIADNRLVFTEDEAKEMMVNYQIPVPQQEVVNSRDQVAECLERIPLPVVMKIVSSDITHKTDSGGVKLNIKSVEEAEAAFDSIISSCSAAYPDANIQGVLIEEMINKKYELIIGSKKDPIFGPIILFGMGGVAVNVFKDMSVGLPPLNMSLAMKMIEKTKIYELLKGYRGMEAMDITSIQFLLYKFAYLVMDFPEIKEIDINPFSIDAEGGMVLDAKIILDEDVVGKKVKPYSHLVISPYPKEYVSEAVLRDGRKVVIRPILPEDEPMEAVMFSKMSKQTQYFRFFGFIREITHEMLTRYTQIDYDREIALIAEVEENGEKMMAGVVRIVADSEGDNAEFAIVVADPWQGQGLGNIFTEKIMEIARERKIKKVYATVLKANSVMVHMFRKRGFTITSQDIESNYAELILD